MTEHEFYFDNSATTKISEYALSSVLQGYEEFGNPSSLHSKGATASKKMKNAALAVAGLMGAEQKGSIIFTSGGTEANNIAVLGGFYSKKRKPGDTVMITDSEHASVELPAQKLERDGFKVLRVPTINGRLDVDFIKQNLSPSVVLASFMYVNNETGAVYDIKKAFSLIKRTFPEVITHTDAVQAYGKLRIDPAALNADMISVSSHKIHGPMGVGALFVSKNIIKAKKISPIIFGGGQQNDLRSGTENLPAILGFSAACDDARLHFDSYVSTMQSIKDKFIDKLSDVDVKINLPEEGAPHILNIRLPGIKSEVMLHFLSSKNIYVSSGSACSSNHPSVSRSLKAFGLSDFDADCSLRISVSHFNTEDEVDYVVDSLREGINTLIRRKK